MNQTEWGLNFILEEYAAALEEWMRVRGADAMREELQLEADSPAGTFWRAGYLQALQDLQSLIRDRDSSDACAQQTNSTMDH